MSEVLAVPRMSRLLLASRKRAGGTAYLEAGSGEAVILIHGVGLNADAWAPQLEELAKTHRVIAIDMLGHGKSEVAPGTVTLDNYIRQVADLMTACGIAAANIVGHSMGGLVAIGFALAHPARTLRLAVFNTVYKRNAENRAAVEARAREITRSGTVGNVEEPLERWFGPRRQQPDIAQDVRNWLASANPEGYGAAYRIFASSDEVFAGKLHGLAMPSLFATGSLDINSSPSMASAMASEARHGKLLVLEGARHLMNLTHADAANMALRELLKTPVETFDFKDLRKAFGSFMTGVTVVTTQEANGNLRGFTANSFSSVSLDPPLLLVCMNKASASCEAFSSAASFAVNILSESQKEVSGVFASKRPDKFANADYTLSASGNPLLAGSLAWFDCAHHDAIDAGDHVILIGRVKSYSHVDANPLGYARGGYVTLGLEQSAVNAAAQAGRTEVGAILECDGKLLVFPAPSGKYELPHVGRAGEAGTASRLQVFLASKGINAKLGFLFAVYENKEDQHQSIYYRGDAELERNDAATLLSFDALPWEAFRDDATRSMLRRYSQERLQGRYRIYSGDQISGDVREVGEGPGA
jgi:flavin reductase (DIM6/NTAB) family NADH-FMN oxidoreductase RutF/pimeloyl-ACP methyl ester carboxylesterase